MGLEGLVAKKADASYKGGRSGNWLKLRAAKSDDFVVVGFTAPKGSRAGLGALHLAQYVDGALTYSGSRGQRAHRQGSHRNSGTPGAEEAKDAALREGAHGGEEGLNLG